MKSVIRSEFKKTINIHKLRSLLPDYVIVKKYDQLRGNSLKDIMGNKTVLVVLWNIHNRQHRVLNQPGHFWLISTRGPEKCVVFSSTGMTYKKELFLTQSDPSLLERVLPKGTIYNNVKLQTSNDSNTCWRWMILYAHLAPMGLRSFQKLFHKPNIHINNSDNLCVLLTLMALY